MKFTMKVTRKPKPFKLEAAITVLYEGVSKFAFKEIGNSFLATTRTWNNKPRWQHEKKREPNKLKGMVYTSSKIYGYLNFGTKVRYATMTQGFKAKTVANFIGSRAGAGGVWFINRLRPKPGIKARGFDKAVAKRWQPRFESKMKPYFIRAAKASGHQI